MVPILPDGDIWVVEIKRTTLQKVSRGFHTGAEDVKASRKLLIYAGELEVPVAEDIRATPLEQGSGLLRHSSAALVLPAMSVQEVVGASIVLFSFTGVANFIVVSCSVAGRLTMRPECLMKQTGFSLSALKRHAEGPAEVSVISFQDSRAWNFHFT